MNEDRQTGNAKNFGGQVEEGFGRATGDVKTQLQGKAKQAEGALQELRTSEGSGSDRSGRHPRKRGRGRRLPAYNHRAAPVHGCRGGPCHRLLDWPLRPPRRLLELRIVERNF